MAKPNRFALSTVKLFLFTVIYTLSFSCVGETPKKKETHMEASGSFEIDMQPQQDLVDAGRMTFTKTFKGDFVGNSAGQMLSHRTKTEGSAGYTALETLTGTLDGKSGTFTVVHMGLMDKGAQSLDIKIIPDSGSDELKGIKGAINIEMKDGQHFYTINYSLEN